MTPPLWLTVTKATSPGANSLSWAREPFSRLTASTVCPLKWPPNSFTVHRCSPVRMSPVSTMSLSSVASTSARTRSAF